MLENLFGFLQILLRNTQRNVIHFTQTLNRIMIWLILDVYESKFTQNFDRVY